MTTTQVLYRGATEYVVGYVTADVDLAELPAPAFSFDQGVTWTAAAWSSGAVDNGDGTWTRPAKLLVVVSSTFTSPGNWTALCKVTATPEIPIFVLGAITVM